VNIQAETPAELLNKAKEIVMDHQVLQNRANNLESELRNLETQNAYLVIFARICLLFVFCNSFYCLDLTNSFCLRSAFFFTFAFTLSKVLQVARGVYFLFVVFPQSGCLHDALVACMILSSFLLLRFRWHYAMNAMSK
jgi:hypothetical protein